MPVDPLPEPAVPSQADLDAVAFDRAAFVADAGADSAPGEAGHDLLERLWARPTLIGMGLDDDLHAPNEKFEARNYLQGIRASAATLQALASLPRAR